MAESSQLTQHIESFVNLSSSPNQQAASLDAIASLLKNNLLSTETLVREMGMYLTTTDDVVRARGILLLGELLTHLASKPLNDATIHSLIAFFTDRLADWKALRGALIGCLALVRRKSSGGVITSNDAKAVAQSYIRNLQVQSLAQHDRKLCFELLECLLQRYPDVVASLGEDFLYAICEAVDGEKDPHCLIITFRILEAVAQLFPDDLLTSFASDLFEILACYFPIHFTHPKGEDFDVKRDDLSRALMAAFSSTSLFEPFAIPLLLEKLSSSLQSAKVDSLKYLSNCAVKYGAEQMEKHAKAVWSSIKDAINGSHEPTLSFSSESLDCVGFQENIILTEALNLLDTVIKQNSGFLSYIIDDEDINVLFNSFVSYKSYNEISSQSKQKLHAVGCILSISAKASLASCSSVMEIFFPRLMDALGLSVGNSSEDCFPTSSNILEGRLNHGALYLCIELLTACRDIVAGSEIFKVVSAPANEKWCCLLKSYSTALAKALRAMLATNTNDDSYGTNIFFGVKGLLILGTFRGGSLIISKSIFENTLLTFTSIITAEFEKTLLWKLALKALVHIGSFIDSFNESEIALSYMAFVIEKIVSLVSSHDLNMPFSLKLEAISEIGVTGQIFLLKTVEGLEDAVCANLQEVLVHGDPKSAEVVVQLLECYSNKLHPRLHESGDCEGMLLRFASNIWNLIEKTVVFSSQFHEKGPLDATMKAMKLAVGSCSVESQSIIVQKAFNVLSSTTCFPMEEPTSDVPIQLNGLQLIQATNDSLGKEAWISSLFASVVIAARPETHFPRVRLVIRLFLTILLKGNVPAAQALGSMVNKLGLKSNGTEINGNCSVEEAMDIIFDSNLWSFNDNDTLRSNGRSIGLTEIFRGVTNSRALQVHATAGLAWIGKGLLMRGHEKVKDVTMIFLECFSYSKIVSFPLEQDNSENGSEYVPKSAADAFQILMGDSEDCLSRKFHATIRPLYKQRFYSTMMPILQSLIIKSESSFSRSMLCRACAHIISDTPLIVVLNDAKKVIPILMDGLSILSNDVLDKDIVYSLLLVLSGVLTDKNGKEAVIECAHIIIDHIIKLISYPYMMLVRETAIQCLVAMSRLPHARIYPMRRQVLEAILKALDDPRRAVRLEAVRCRQAWASIASRSLHF